MTFTRQEVEKQFEFLKSIISIKKKSIESLYVSNELLDSSNIEIQFMGSQILYQRIKEKIIDFYLNKEELSKFREVFFNKLIEKSKKSPQIVLERLCFGVSIIMTLGILSFWENCIEEIINFGIQSSEHCLLSIIIIENIPKEWSEIHISNKHHLKIRDLFKEKLKIIENFIIKILETSLIMSDNEIKRNLIDKVFNLIISWIKFGINIFQSPRMSELILKQLNDNNMKLISNIFSESSCKSIYSRIYEDQEKYDLHSILQLVNRETLTSIENTIALINDLISKLYNEKNVYQNYNMINHLSIMFSYILENFIFILFLKNKTSEMSLMLLYNLSTMKILKISQKLFEIFREMREFINKGYKFENFNNEEKKGLCDYLINVCVGVLENSKLKSLKIEEAKVLNSTDDLNEDEEYTGDLEISIAEFRKYSGDLFYNVFLIFSSNFSIEGENYFFSKFLEILKNAHLFYEQNQKNDEYLLIIEVVIFFVRNLIQAMNSDHHFEFITKFIKTILKSYSLNNEKILHSFILLIKEGTSIIPMDNENFCLIVQFLSNLIKNTNLSAIACEVLLSISKSISMPNVACFEFCYKIYEEKYDSLNVNTLLLFTESLSNLVGIFDKEINKLVLLNDQQVFEFFSLIIKPAIFRIKGNFTTMMNNQGENINNFKLEFLKSYGISNIIMKQSFRLTNDILENVFISFINETLPYTEALYKILCQDTNFIKEMNSIFFELIKNIGFRAVNYFDKFNEIYLSSYLSNSENIMSLEIIGVLYSNVIAYNNDKKQVVSKNFQFLGSRVLDNIMKNLNNRIQIELIDIFANFIIKITETINYLFIDKEFFDRLILIYLEALQKITEPSVNKNIVKLFYYILSFSTIFNREFIYPHFSNIIASFFKSLGRFEINISQQFAKFIISAFIFDNDQTFNTINFCLNSQEFDRLKPDHINIIIKFLKIYKNKENEIICLIQDLINISKGLDVVDLITYEMKISFFERKEKAIQSENFLK